MSAIDPLRVLKFPILILNNHLYTRQSQKAPCSISELTSRDQAHVSARSIRNSALIHDRQHVVLGLVGQYDETHPRISVPTLLLGLRARGTVGQLVLGIDPRQRRRA